MCSIFTPFIIFYYVVLFGSAKNGGFSTMFYHRDGPGTPFYDPSLSKIDRLNRDIDRDLAQGNRTRTNTPNTPIADFKNLKGHYLMKLALGTPPYEFFAFADTGSDMTWIQCNPCVLCYPQNNDIFEHIQSQTYQTVTCISGQVSCPDFRGVKCERNVCTYVASYGDGAKFSQGLLSTDMMTIKSVTGHSVQVDNFIFRCGDKNEGKFDANAVGIIGLGRGPQSLITQLDMYIKGRFSYCLPQNFKNGKINFGDNAVVEGPGVVTTPLTKSARKNIPFYRATLEGLTIGTERVNYNTNPGNIIIDSGTILTLFPSDFLVRVINSVTRQITGRRVEDPNKRFQACFKDVDQFTPITTHFAGGANVVLNKFNMFRRFAGKVTCLTLVENKKAVWGNVAQMEFLIGFNVRDETLSFKPTGC